MLLKIVLVILVLHYLYMDFIYFFKSIKRVTSNSKNTSIFNLLAT